jgi:hypothetical protein
MFLGCGSNAGYTAQTMGGRVVSGVGGWSSMAMALYDREDNDLGQWLGRR